MSSLISGFTGRQVVSLVLNIAVLLAPHYLSNVRHSQWLKFPSSSVHLLNIFKNNF